MARPDREARAEYIAQQAAARGIDPEIAVAVAAAEGLNAPGMQSNISASSAGKTGVNGREPSFGDFQMLTGRDNDYGPGLGDEMINQTGVDPREETSWKESINFALDNVVRDGWDAWAGAKAIGVGKWDGVSANAVELGVFSQPEAQPQAKPDRDAPAVQTAQTIDSFGMPGVGIPNVSAMNNAPSVNAFAPTIDTVAVDPFEAVINDQQTQQGGLRDRAASVAANAAITQPEGLLGYAFSDRTVRDQEIQPELAGIIGRATQAMGPEYAFSVTSGGQPAIGTSLDRVGSTRHDLGFAADGRLTVDGRGITYSQDPDLYAELAKQAGVQGAQGFGHYGWGVHIDNARPGAWGPDRTSATLSPAVRDAFNEGKAVRDAGLYSPTGPQAKPDIGRSLSRDTFTGATPATAYGPSLGATDFAAIAPDGYSDFGMALSPSRDLADYASVVDQNVGQGRSTSAGRSYVDVDLNDFAVTNPASDFSVPSVAVDLGNGVFGIERGGPTAAMPADVSIATISPDRGLAPLDAPQSIGSRPDLGWAADLQTSTPSIGTAATTATAPTSNVATAQGNQQQGGGFFGGIGSALGGFFDTGFGSGLKDTAMATAVGGPIAGGVVALDSIFGDGVSKDKGKDGKGKGVFGRARDTLDGARNTTIGSALTGAALGGKIGAAPGALIGGAIGLGRGLARNGMPNLGIAFDGTPSIGHAALGYAMNQSRNNPNYTGWDFSRDFSKMGGAISNGRPAPGQVTAAEFNAAQRDAGKAIGVMEGLSRDFSEAFGKDKDSGTGESKGGCFLTTAAVDVTGEADNGDTLQTLRWFRDNIMRARPDWSEDVDEYYRIAPAIVERLNGDKATYERLMKEHIRPAVKAIKAGEYERAYRVYRAMVGELEGAQ